MASANIKLWIKTHERTVFWTIIILFVAIRLCGIGSPLHQDEYKWPQIANPSVASGSIPHPPLSELIYRIAGHITGYDIRFRYIPLFFGVLNLALLYFYLKRRSSLETAMIGAVIFCLSYFSILASLMVDTDGAIMPFFLLLCLIFYDRVHTESYKKGLWFGLLIFFAVLGCMVKVSFLLCVVAMAADFLWDKRNILRSKTIIRYTGFGIMFIVGLGVLLLLADKFVHFFNLRTSVAYWAHFANLNHNWFQVFIQVVKSLLYASPFLICVPFLLGKEQINKVRIPLFFIASGLIFYVILFDFSTGALDRYMQFIIVPLCIIAATLLAGIFEVETSKLNKFSKNIIGFVSVAVIIIFLLQFYPHFIPSLHPKSEWVSRIFSGRWNFVFPFSGGSGPLGFYVSFLFMGLSWILSIVLTVWAIAWPQFKRTLVVCLIMIGLVYNGVFAEEYFFGWINGSARSLVILAAAYIKSNPAITKVIVYNDNGGYEIQQTGKYERRLYADPMFVDGYKKIFADFRDYLLVIDIPKVDQGSIYAKFINACTPIYEVSSQKITSKVYDCRNVIDIDKILE